MHWVLKASPLQVKSLGMVDSAWATQSLSQKEKEKEPCLEI